MKKYLIIALTVAGLSAFAAPASAKVRHHYHGHRAGVVAVERGYGYHHRHHRFHRNYGYSSCGYNGCYRPRCCYRSCYRPCCYNPCYNRCGSCYRGCGFRWFW